MANETTFNQRAQSYNSGRPGYAPAAMEHIFTSMLPAGGVVADVGAGTGIFTKEAVSRGFLTYAVEPNEEMCSVLRQNFADEPLVHIVPAAAEHTTLPDHSVDLVVAASAFHWFDAAAFRKECLRILKPGGMVSIFINARDYDDAFTQKQHDICLQYCPKFSSLSHGVQKIGAAMPAFLGEQLQQGKFDFPLYYTKQKFIDRSLSSSYAPDPGTEPYTGYIAALRQLLEETTAEDSIVVPNATVMFWGKLEEA